MNIDDILKWDQKSGKIQMTDKTLGDICYKKNYVKVKSKRFKYCDHEFYYFDILKGLNKEIQKTKSISKNSGEKCKKNRDLLTLYMLKSLFALNRAIGNASQFVFCDKKDGIIVIVSEESTTLIKKKADSYKKYQIPHHHSYAKELFLLKQFSEGIVDKKTIQGSVLPVLLKFRGHGKTVKDVDFSKYANTCASNSSELKKLRVTCKAGVPCDSNGIDDFKSVSFVDGELREISFCCINCMENYKFAGFGDITDEGETD